jgi:hypothetical protein
MRLYYERNKNVSRAFQKVMENYLYLVPQKAVGQEIFIPATTFEKNMLFFSKVYLL